MLSSKFDVERSKVKVMISGGSRAEFGGHVEREAYNGGLQGKAPISGVQGVRGHGVCLSRGGVTVLKVGGGKFWERSEQKIFLTPHFLASMGEQNIT